MRGTRSKPATTSESEAGREQDRQGLDDVARRHRVDSAPCR